MKIKLSWKVGEVPTGRYRSFQKRSWPHANFAGTERPAAMLLCEDSYEPRNVKSGKHAPITVCIAEYKNENRGTGPAFVWRKLKNKSLDIELAKKRAEAFLNLEQNKNWLPADLFANKEREQK